MRVYVSLSGIPISVARLIYIRERGSGEREGELRKRFSCSDRVAILAPELRYFLHRRYVHDVPTYHSVTTERRNRDLYLPESAVL